MLRRWLGLLALMTLALCSVPFGRAVGAPVGFNTATIGASQATVVVQLQNHSACTALLGAGLTGTEIFEASNDGNTWIPVTSFPDPGNAATGVQSVVNPAAGSYQSNVGGYAWYRVRISAYTSGSNVVSVNCTTGVMAATQVNTGSAAAPNPTCSPAINAIGNCGMLVGPSTEPAAPTGGFQAIVSQNGVQAVTQCAQGAAAIACANPTASPNAGAALAMVPYSPCYNNAGTTNCFQGAQSPAPPTVQSVGFNGGGAAAPIICRNTFETSGTTISTTQMIALSGTTHIYVCELDLSGIASVAGNLHILSGTGSNCATPVNQGPGTEVNTTGTGNLAVGTGVGLIFDGGAGNALCITGAGTMTFWLVHVMYEQF